MGKYVSAVDGPLDADRGSSTRSKKRGVRVDQDEYEERAEERLSARNLDRRIEATRSRPGLTRARRDKERAFPRPTPATVGHPAMRRRLPQADDVRTDLSSRQKKARSSAKRAVQEAMPQSQYRALEGMMSEPSQWREVNDQLSEVNGDAVLLTVDERARVQRVDRAIQGYEKASDRGHVVYANVELPSSINRSNITQFLSNQFERGDQVAFDRFTGATHTMHQTTRDQSDRERTCVFEIQTRRGAYLGRSDSLDDTAHLLPRGMRMAVAGTHVAQYVQPDGTLASCTVVQLVDTEERQA